MKKLLYSLLIAAMPVLATAQDGQGAQPVLSPSTSHYLNEVKTNAATYQDGFIYKHINGKVYVSALIKVANPSQAAQSIKALDAFVGTKAGSIWTVQVPVEKVPAFTKAAGVAEIQLDEPVFPAMSAARKTTRADSVQLGINLPKPYTGKGVVMGVIDFGFDYKHPTFYDTLGTKYRIKKVWELNTNGTPPSGYSYGHEMTDSTTIKAKGTDNMDQTHGTGTAGIAAGSGVANVTAGTAFRGMAFESDLIMVGVRRDSIGGQWLSGGFSDFVDGVNYIFTQATAMGKPCVINISWGSQSGAHDGTSLFNQACNNLSGAGKIIVMSAGNEGRENIHLNKTFTATDTVLKTALGFTPATYQRTWVDVWGEAGKTFCGRVSLHANNNATPTAATAYFCLGSATQNTYLLSTTGDTCYVEFIPQSPAPNGKPRLTMNIWNKSSETVSINVKATSGTVHLWDEYYYYGYKYGFQSAFTNGNMTGYQIGNTNSTVSDMGSAESVLLVGAYASKIRWTDINGNSQSYITYTDSGRIVPFSSKGPMIDGRIKPDILAPGLTLATAYSSYDTAVSPLGTSSDKAVNEYVHPVTGKKYYYGEFIGTSASSPAAAGIVAMMLQAKPTLTPQQAKDIIFETALTDLFTGQLPAAGDNRSGHGKINAYGALKKLAQEMGLYQYSGRKLDCALFPNPNNGSFLLDYTGGKSQLLKVEVITMTGAVATMETWAVTAGSNQRNMNASSLPKGTYLVKVTSADGNISMKMVLQ